MRYVYLKNGDAVVQAKRVLQGGRHTGADAYIGSFLSSHADDDVLMLCRSQPKERFEYGRLVAESFPGPKVLPPKVRRLWSALRIGVQMLAWRPDRIVCGCAQEILWVSVLVAGLLRIPIVVSRHTGMPSSRGLRLLSRRMEEFFLRRCEGVLCHGPYLSDLARQAGVPTARIFQFGVDFQDFARDSQTKMAAPEPLEVFCGGQDFLFMYVGRMQENKGVFDLLDAFKLLIKRSTAQCGLVYVGEGEDLARLRDQARDAGLNRRVLILGRVSHDKLAAVIKRATAVVTPTQSQLPEGRCKVVIEALVAGVPVIAPNFAFFPYAVSHGDNGLLYRPGDLDQLSLSMQGLVEDSDLRTRLQNGASISGSRYAAERSLDYASAVDMAFRVGMG